LTEFSEDINSSKEITNKKGRVSKTLPLNALYSYSGVIVEFGA